MPEAQLKYHIQDKIIIFLDYGYYKARFVTNK